jgi:hypothetical protein
VQAPRRHEVVHVAASSEQETRVLAALHGSADIAMIVVL